MTPEELTRLEQLQEELKTYDCKTAVPFMGLEKLEELLQLLIKKENVSN
jgi:peroxiredoxin family protein